MNRSYVLFALLAAMPCAWAVNKCTLPDGRVVYQEAACPSAAKEAETVKTWGAGASRGYFSARSSGRWEFVQRRDDMTGQLTCAAFSPSQSFYAQPGDIQYQRRVNIRALVLFDARAAKVALHLDDERDRFDRNTRDMGVKTPNGSFMPISEAGGSVALVADSATLIAEMEQSGSLKARVRIWPWDRLHDLEPFKLSGFSEAMKRGRACALELAGVRGTQ